MLDVCRRASMLALLVVLPVVVAEVFVAKLSSQYPSARRCTRGRVRARCRDADETRRHPCDGPSCVVPVLPGRACIGRYQSCRRLVGDRSAGGVASRAVGGAHDAQDAPCALRLPLDPCDPRHRRRQPARGYRVGAPGVPRCRRGARGRRDRGDGSDDSGAACATWRCRSSSPSPRWPTRLATSRRGRGLRARVSVRDPEERGRIPARGRLIGAHRVCRKLAGLSRTTRSVAMVLLFGGVAACQARGSAITLAVVVVLWAIKEDKVRLSPLAIVGATLLIIMTYVSVDAAFRADQSGAQFNSVNSRISTYDASLRVWRSDPVVGVGLKYWRDARFAGELSFGEPHDLAVSALGESGVIGLAALAVLVLGSIGVVARGRSPLATFAALIVIAKVADSAVGIFWVAGTLTVAWIVVGMACATDPSTGKRASEGTGDNRSGRNGPVMRSWADGLDPRRRQPEFFVDDGSEPLHRIATSRSARRSGGLPPRSSVRGRRAAERPRSSRVPGHRRRTPFRRRPWCRESRRNGAGRRACRSSRLRAA